jgi:hypothetical protein
MRLTVCGGGTVVEGEILAFFTGINTFLENVVLFPEFTRGFFSLDKIEVR